MASIADAVISLGVAPNTHLQQQVTDVVKKINNVLTDGLNTISKMIAPSIGLALAGITRGFALEIERVGIAADRLNMPVEQMDAWAGAANMAGVSTETLIGSMDALHNAMVAAARFEGGGLLREMMRGYMPQVGDMDAVEQYMLGIADAVKNLDATTAHRELSKIGIGDPKLQRWLRQGSDAIRTQIELSKKLGVISEEDRLIADRMNFAMRSVQRTFERILLPMFRIIAPAMEKVSLTLLYLKKHWELFVPAIVLGTAKISLAFAKMALGFVAFHPVLTLIMGALAALGVLFEDLMVWTRGGNVAFANIWESMFGTPETLNQFVKGVKDAWNALTDPESNFYTLEDFIYEVAALFELTFGDKIDKLVKYIKEIPWKEIFQKAFNVAKEMATKAFEFIKQWYQSVDWKQLFNDVYTTLSSVLSEIGEILKEIFGSIDWKGIWQSLKDAFNSVDWKAIATDIVDFFAEAFKTIDWSGIWDGIKAQVSQIGEWIAKAFKSIDWNGIFNDLTNSLANVATQLWESLSSVDWSKVFADMFTKLICTVADLLTWLIVQIANINWFKLLIGLLSTLGKFLGSIVDFLLEIDWLSVFFKVGKLLIAAILTSVKTLLQFVFGLIVGVVPMIWEAATKPGFKAMKKWFNFFFGMLKKIKECFPDWMKKVKGWFIKEKKGENIADEIANGAKAVAKEAIPKADDNKVGTNGGNSQVITYNQDSSIVVNVGSVQNQEDVDEIQQAVAEAVQQIKVGRRSNEVTGSSQ